MKQVALFCLLLWSLTAARAQVVHAATGRNISLTAGGMFSLFEPDYLGGFSGQASGLSLLYGLDGVTGFADMKFSRWVQVEAETRFLRFNLNQVTVSQPFPQVASEAPQDTYLIGPRLPWKRYKGFTPYGKVLGGLGRTSLSPALTASAAFPRGFQGNVNAIVLALGGGVDYRLTKRIQVRAADFEYQQWMMHINIPGKQYSPLFHPWGVSAGVSYRVF